jgi:hypothetical protein
MLDGGGTNVDVSENLFEPIISKFHIPSLAVVKATVHLCQGCSIETNLFFVVVVVEVIAEVKRHYDLLNMADTVSDSLNSCLDRKRLAMTQLQRTLGRMQEIGDQKLAMVAEIIERVENKTRQLEQNVENLGKLRFFLVAFCCSLFLFVSPICI